MLSALIALAALSQQSLTVSGSDVAVRAVHSGQSVNLEFLVRDAAGEFRVAAVTTPAMTGDLGFQEVTKSEAGLRLKGSLYICNVAVPESGSAITILVENIGVAGRRGDALFGVVLAPDGKPARATQALLPSGSSDGVATTESFATPLAMAIGGGYGIALMPDVQDLEWHRPMPPVLILRNDTAAKLSYGFAPYDRDQGWKPTLAQRHLDAPRTFYWRFDLIVATDDKTVEAVIAHLWQRDGAERAHKPLPQTVPFLFYTKPTYDMPQTSEEKVQGLDAWWTGERDGKVRAPRGADGQAKLTNDGNIARFAWGMRWWGNRLDQFNWRDNADEMMNLVVSAPPRDGLTPVAFDTASETWRYEDENSEAAAQTARWMLKYAEAFPDYPGREKLFARVGAIVAALGEDRLTGQAALVLSEVARSPAFEGSDLAAITKGRLSRSHSRLIALASLYERQHAAPSPETVSLTLYLAQSQAEGSQAAALRLARSLFLHQALWQPMTVVGTEVFGAFPAEHFLEESQSVYTADLLEACVLLGDQALATRAVVALRAPLGLFNHQTHSIAGIILPANIELHRSAPWFGQNGQAAFGAWRGVAEGVGQTLTSIAATLDKYGSYYSARDGWSLGVDGVRLDAEGRPFSAFSANPISYEGAFPFEHVNPTTGERTKGDRLPSFPTMRAFSLTLDSQGVSVIALPGFIAQQATTELSGTFTFGDGTSVKAEFMLTGFGVRATPEILAAGPVTFAGAYRETSLSLPRAVLLAIPPRPSDQWPRGWRRMKGLSDIVRATVTGSDGKPVVSTADDGRGARDQRLTGVIESQAFLLTSPNLRFNIAGAGKPGLRVEIVDVAMGVPVLTFPEPGEAVCDLSESVGKQVRVRLVDESSTGSVEIGEIRLAS
ncbi:MAG: hypothetical protein WD716_08780 [Fimbriimonadaceae bacterium]